MRYKNIIKPIIFTLGLILILLLVSAFTSRYGFIQGPYSKMTGVFKAPTNSLDYLVIGDSESCSSISPMEIWKEFGFAGYNCGIPGQPLKDNYHWLEKALKNQSPKVILLETNAFYRNTTYMKELETTFKLQMSASFSIFQYHNDWLHISLKDLKREKSKPHDLALRDGAGFKNTRIIKPYVKGPYIKKTKEKEIIKEIPMSYLNKIVALCKQKNIELILYSSPSPVCWTYQKHNAAAAFAKENKLQYIDLNIRISEVGIDWSKDTRDNGNHVNYFGSQKVTKYIGKYLSKHTDMTDHRNNKNYESWNEALEHFINQPG